MEEGSDVVSDAVATKVVALIPVVDGNEQRIDAIAETPVFDDRVDVEETAVVEDMDIASTSLSKKVTKHAAYMANKRSTESAEQRESRLADDRARKAKSRQAEREQTAPEPTRPGTEPDKRQVRLDADAARKRVARTKGSSTKREEVTTELATKTNAESATLLQDQISADRKRKLTSEEEHEKRQARLDADAARKRLARAKGSSIKREEETTELVTKTNADSAIPLKTARQMVLYVFIAVCSTEIKDLRWELSFPTKTI